MALAVVTRNAAELGYRVNVTLDMILGVEDILISWFVIILALLGVASLFVCCMIHHCKHLRLSDALYISMVRSRDQYACAIDAFPNIRFVLLRFLFINLQEMIVCIKVTSVYV